jgi:exonuclease SbcC
VVDTEIAKTYPDLAIQNLDEEIGALADLGKRAAQLPALKLSADESAVALAALQGAAEQLTVERAVTIPAKLQAIAVQLNGERQRVEAELTRADEFQSTLFGQRLAGIAGELSERLVAGAPCPVCGSLEHPVPTQSVVAPVSERALADAKLQLDIQSQARIQIERQISLVETVMADGLVDEIQTSVAEEFSAADVELELGELQQRLAEVNYQLNKKIVRAAELRTLIKEQVDAYQRGIAEIATALGSGADINGRIDLLKSARAAIEKVRITSVAATQAAATHTSAMQALASSGVEVDAEVLATAQSQLAALVADEQLLLGAHANLLELAEAVESLGAEVAAAALEVDELAERIGPIIRIADVLNGRGANSLLQPLKAYVVQQMFDEVIAAANIRLSGMLAGRFALVDTEQATGRERSLGLGLEIADLVSETNRRTETLSGGETFCASLALALGLADTVKSHAGGVDIGVLFVDEGFGALDQERLDDVMTELLKLRADGRTVGVISHVSEMKKSIMERITVIPLGADKGSTLEVSWMQ